MKLSILSIAFIIATASIECAPLPQFAGAGGAGGSSAQ